MKRVFQTVVTPQMRRLLIVVLVVVAVLFVNSTYLSAVSFVQWWSSESIENYFYQWMFLVHLVLGVGIIVPALLFIGLHLRRAISRPNRIAVRLGIATFTSVLVLFVTGVALTRGLPFFELREPMSRQLIYWLHVIAPIAVVWLFLLHRIVGPKIRWKAGFAVLVVGAMLSFVGVYALIPSEEEPTTEVDFFPALASTASGSYLPESALMIDEYCESCHPDVHAQWSVSAHRFASFNNPAYSFAVNNTRAKVLERDGNVHAARFCAGCHDPVPLFTGAFDDPDFDFENERSAHAGITCTSCHSIIEISSPRGNADYVIEESQHYPFARSDSTFLRWVNALLIKGQPSFHKRTFLKTFHREAEFCGTCHKVHLPVELNGYKWLRGQNHYDSYLLSGVSGHGIQSFYYPERAIETCNHCHMVPVPSNDFAAKLYEEHAELAIRDHQFPAANTALVAMTGIPESVNRAHEKMLHGALRVDIFALREGDELEVEPFAPLDQQEVTLQSGKTYVFDVVLRTLTLGHKFTEGTVDSNEIWLEIDVVTENDRLYTSGALLADGAADPDSHFVNAYILDRFGNRIALRNAEDIFTKLYDHQIAPGSASVVSYRLDIPDHVEGPLTITAKLNYRKFDTNFVRAFQGDEFEGNALPVTLMASDTVTLGAMSQNEDPEPHAVLEWIRWNDYGIGWLNKPNKSALRQAELAFQKVTEFGRGEGHLNLARVYLAEGRLEEAAEQLRLSEQLGAYPWSIAWFGGLIELQSGQLEQAIRKFRGIVDTQFTEARNRNFDFSLDYRLRNTLARAYFEYSKIALTDEERVRALNDAIQEYQATLEIDPENATAHYGLAQIYSIMKQDDKEAIHRAQHEKYRIDDNAKDRAVAIARQNDAVANRAAEDVVIYSLKAE